MKKKRKIKWKNVIAFLFLIFFIITLIISLIQIFKWKKDSENTHSQIDELEEITNITEVEDHEETEIIEQEEIDEDNPYWDYIKMNLIDVDFSKLKEINKETVGWIQVQGTNINYPFVQTKDNKYYLTHSFDKSKNEAGWVFLDYRNDLSSLNKNTIIYAHGRIDQVMFGTLKNILNTKWIENTDNYIIKLSTEYENTLWQIFSAYHIPTTSDYLQTNFQSSEEFLTFANTLLQRSAHDFQTTIKDTDHILTLSTCYNNKEKMVLHAKLIKREKRS